jgi:hypothetical protein
MFPVSGSLAFYDHVFQIVMSIRLGFNFKGPKTNLTVVLRNGILHKSAVNFAILNIT